MALDGIFLNFLKKETERNAVGCRVDKVYQPTRDEIVLFLRSKDFNGRLLISANTVGARIHFTEFTPENPPVPPMLCMLLRKKLIGARLTEIRQIGLERVLFLDFDATNEFGDKVTLTLILEVMGRRSNIILCDENQRVIDAIRRTDAADNVRVLMPGIKYVMPPAQDKADLLLDGPEKVIKALDKYPQYDIAQSLQESVQGMSPIVCREIMFLAAKDSLKIINDLTDDEKTRLKYYIFKINTSITNNTPSPTMVSDKNGKLIDYSFMNILQYGFDCITKPYKSFAELLDGYYAKRDNDAILNAKKQELLKIITNTYSRISRRIEAQKKELKAAQNCEHLRKYGELIKANIHLIEKGSSFCEVPDYYTDDCSDIKIPLSNNLTAAQNAQKYFKDYRKACTASKLLSGFIEKGENELLYIDSVFDELSRAETTAEITEIRAEFVEQGYIKEKSSRRNQRKISFKQLPMHFRSSDGFEIFVGRNNKQNDQLTLKTANNNDIWLHIKNSAGAHVVIVTDGNTVPDSTVEQAAVIAATFSKASEGAAVAVDYCEIRKVKKPTGAAPGMVIYDNYNTAFVKPDKKLVESLAIK